MPQLRIDEVKKQYFGRDLTLAESAELTKCMQHHDAVWGDSTFPGNGRIWSEWDNMESPYLKAQRLPGNGLNPSSGAGALQQQLMIGLSQIAVAVKQHKQACIEEVSRILLGDRVREAMEGVYEGIVSGQHIFLYGTAGVGKTTLVKHLCNVMGVPWDRLDGQSDMADIHLMGSFLPKQGGIEFVPGPLLRPGNLVLLIDELPRIPASVSNILLQPMAERSLAFADLAAGGTRQVQLSPGFVLIGTGNPFHYGGMAQKNEAVFDRFGMGFDMPHPSNMHRKDMLKKTGNHTTARPLWLQPVGDPKGGLTLTLADIRVAASRVQISDAHLDHIIAISSLVSPKEYCRRVQWEDAFPGLITTYATPQGFTESEAKQLWSAFHEINFEEMVDETVQEGSNPRGEEMMAGVARIAALADGRIVVNDDDIAKAAMRCLRFRLKPHPSMEPMISEIIRIATAVQLREYKHLAHGANIPSDAPPQWGISRETWKRLKLNPNSSKHTFAVLFNLHLNAVANPDLKVTC